MHLHSSDVSFREIDWYSIKVNSIEADEDGKETNSLYFHTEKGTIRLSLNESETQNLFREVNKMTGWFGE